MMQEGGAVENAHSPPSSAEEAAALLGAAISFDALTLSTPKGGGGHPNPPQGMHSVFAVQTPVPNQALFVRLVNLRAWLRWHADASEDSPGLDGFDDGVNRQLGISFPMTKRKKTKEHFDAARSILAVLMKLLEASSAVANGEVGINGTDEASKVVPRQIKHVNLPNKNKQHKPLPALLSTPLRNVWVECISLCLALGCSLSGNLRIDVYAFLGKMMEISSWNPRSKMAAGGVRLATLEVLGHACIMNTDLAKRTAPYALEILQCCHKGLLSGGAGEPGHRSACVKTACQMLVACRRAANSSFLRRADSFAVPGAIEEVVAVEAIKFIRRATSDKYPEVRMGAAVFAGLAAPLLIRIVPFSGSQRGVAMKDGDASPLVWLEDVTQMALRNIDDESAGVSTAWSATLARCLCASAEYGASVRNAKSEDQASKRSADVDDEAMSPADGLDLAGKLKAFSEARRAVAATTACSSVISTIVYLVSQFVKTGGETVACKCGGLYSIGGRASRIGFADSITEFLRLQAARGGFPLVEALGPVLEMVGESFEKQIRKKEGSFNSMDFHAPASPRSPDKKPPTASIFLARNSKANSTSDSSIGRILTSSVVRRGISENLSESSQLMTLRQLTSACRSSVSSISADGGSGAKRGANTDDHKQLNRHQLQVALVEISHLIVALGEAGASSLEDLLPVLRDSLSHADAGVRHEASAVYASISQAFPTEGRTFVIECLGTFGANLDAIQSLSRVTAASSPAPRSRFRHSNNNDQNIGTTPTAELMKHQATLHGNALAVSMLMHEFPHIIGGIATVIVSKVFDVVGKLLECQFNEGFVKSNPSAACTCIRAGYCLLSGALSMGIDAVVPHHVTTVFSFWQNSCLNLLPGVSKLAPSSDLLWLETMLASVVSFLKFSPNLLLAVPDALTRLTAILEKIFPLIDSGGRFDREANDPVGSARLSSARSSVMEAYSWLPPGSFPLSADRIFSFAAAQIQELNGSDTLCSILDSLVSSEDKLIEASSIERANGPGQVGGTVALDNNISIRSSDVVHHNEREAVLHLLAWRTKFQNGTHDDTLSLYLREDDNSIPTALHEVGTWRVPPDPIGTSKVRLLDSSIHVFAATFGLQDGHTQSEALRMIENLYTFTQVEKSKGFNVGSSLIAESQGKVKPPEEDVTASNAIAIVLACLQALPLHESNYDILVDRGPPWMEKATSLLLRLLPSPSGIIRRGAAEGLSLLATLGVSEDAHTLQSTILHSLDEVMKGSNSGANPKTNAETLPFAKAGSLLALACVQRATKRMKKSEDERAISRSVARESVVDSDEGKTPVMIMMTRVLPSLATQNPEGDSLLARTYALHSFGVLISNSISTKTPLSPDQVQIIWKAVESVEASFIGAWSAVVSEISRGREREKFASSPAFLAVLVRLMTTLLPWLNELKHLDRWIASRFSCYVSTALEFSSNHPAVLFEGCVFFERLSSNKVLVRLNNCCVITTDNTAATAMPFLISLLRPPSAKVVAVSEQDFSNCHGPVDAQRSAVLCLKELCCSSKSPEEEFTFDVGKALFIFLHDRCGRRKFQHFSDFRSLALSRVVVNFFGDCQMLETEVIALIQSILTAQFTGRDKKQVPFILLQWLLFCRCLATGDSSKDLNEPDSHYDTVISTQMLIERARLIARVNASFVLKFSNPPRWQLKCVSANVASVAMHELLSIADSGSSFLFNLTSAQLRCDLLRKDNDRYGLELHSQPIFHLEELVTTACGTSTATSNHSELPSVQICGLRLLVSLFRAFGSQVDSTTNDGSSVLEQYTSQILSSVKHALNAETLVKESVPGTAFHRLFAAGCEALYVMISEELISDPIAMRRLLQPVLTATTESPYVHFPTGDGSDNYSLLMSSTHVTDDFRSYPLFRLSKLSFIAKASMLTALSDIKPSTVSMLVSELEREEIGMAVHCAATAIDGFLLYGSQGNEATPRSSGLTYKNTADLDDVVIEMMVESWPILSAAAISSMIKAIEVSGKECEDRKFLHQWITKLAPVVLSGLRISLSDLKSEVRKSSGLECAALVYAVRLIVKGFEFVGEECVCSLELGDIANIVTESVIFMVLGLSDSEGGKSPPLPKELKILTQQSCGLIEDLCQQHSAIGVDASILTRAVITPLVALQEGRAMDFNIISSCIRSSQSLFQSHPEEGRAEFEKSLIQLVLTFLRVSLGLKEGKNNAACLSLLQACCEKSHMSHQEWGQLAMFTASHGLWDAWAVICSTLPPMYGIMCSINTIKASLGDLYSGSCHAAAIVALRTELQSASVEDPSLICPVLQNIGCEILQLLRAHALHILAGKDFDETRLTVCAEVVKINVMAFQYLNSVSKEEGKAVSFILTLFEVLVESISFNGMPNYPAGKVGGDESIGKMCAQVFVHVARSSPILFKSTVTMMSMESRAVLESAVRADMSGYAAPKLETKKKISLKGFVR